MPQLIEQDNRSIPDVLHSIADNVEVLVESQVELAKAELREAGHEAKAAVVPLSIGLSMVQLAVGLLLLAAVSALATRYPLWLSALMVAVVTGVVAFLLLAQGRRLLERVGQSSSATALRRGGTSHG
jgi:uncharacterized membrane protein YqjE